MGREWDNGGGSGIMGREWDKGREWEMGTISFQINSC